MGFDAWLSTNSGFLTVNTNHGEIKLNLEQVSLQDNKLELGGLNRVITVSRLPSKPLNREMQFSEEVEINSNGDTPIWICVTTEDGYQAWSSPIYLIR
jgi:hypothetical protein